MSHRMYDASTPPAFTVPAGGAIAGYIGVPDIPGAPDTPHIWTVEEWQRFDGVRKLPIFTRSNPDLAKWCDDLSNILAAIAKLGIPTHHPVALDVETAVAPTYVYRVSMALHMAGGHPVWVYGSASTVFGNQADHYWVGDWTGKPHNYRHRHVVATQWAPGGATVPYDTSSLRWRAWRALRDWRPA